MRTLPAAALLLAGLLAGCAAGEERTPNVTADLITPGTWDIRADTDRVMAWAHNEGDADTPIAWSITGAGVQLQREAAGPAKTAVNATVHASRGAVSGPGSRVEVHYEGRFADTGEAFDDGDFPTTLGQGQTVRGFDYGLMGLASGETALLVIPPPFGYGYDPPPSHAKFAGKTLAFGVTLTSLQG